MVDITSDVEPFTCSRIRAPLSW